MRTPTSRPRVFGSITKPRFNYTHYSELGSNQFSFDRLEAFASVTFDLSKSLPKPLPGNLCWTRLNGRGGVTPFAWKILTRDATLGPSLRQRWSLHPTLLKGAQFLSTFSPLLGRSRFRGRRYSAPQFVDYRFRAPNRLLTQVDFDKAIANLGIKGNPSDHVVYTRFMMLVASLSRPVNSPISFTETLD